VIVSLLAQVVYFALLLFFFAMWARLILDLARSFVPRWRPTGVLLIIAEMVFTITDPPIRAVRRVIPPLRLGQVAIDFGWIIVMIAVRILMSLVQSVVVLA
jgi:YggT family protein